MQQSVEAIIHLLHDDVDVCLLVAVVVFLIRDWDINAKLVFFREFGHVLKKLMSFLAVVNV